MISGQPGRGPNGMPPGLATASAPCLRLPWPHTGNPAVGTSLAGTAGGISTDQAAPPPFTVSRASGGEGDGRPSGRRRAGRHRDGIRRIVLRSARRRSPRSGTCGPAPAPRSPSTASPGLLAPAASPAHGHGRTSAPGWSPRPAAATGATRTAQGSESITGCDLAAGGRAYGPGGCIGRHDLEDLLVVPSDGAGRVVGCGAAACTHPLCAGSWGWHGVPRDRWPGRSGRGSRHRTASLPTSSPTCTPTAARTAPHRAGAPAGAATVGALLRASGVPRRPVGGRVHVHCDAGAKAGHEARLNAGVWRQSVLARA